MAMAAGIVGIAGLGGKLLVKPGFGSRFATKWFGPE
jgi:hypothetical protein